MWLRYGFGYSCEYSHCVWGCSSGAFRNRLNSDGASGTGCDTVAGCCDRGDTIMDEGGGGGGCWDCVGGGMDCGGGGDLPGRRSLSDDRFLFFSSSTLLLLLLLFWLLLLLLLLLFVGDVRSDELFIGSDDLWCRLWWPWWWWWWWCRLCPDTVVNSPLWPLIPVRWCPLLVTALSALTFTLIGPNGSAAVLVPPLSPSTKTERKKEKLVIITVENIYETITTSFFSDFFDSKP